LWSRFRDVQLGDEDEWKTIIFGDSAYQVGEYLRSYLKAAELVDDYAEWNGAMKRVRISIEWNYGYTINLFRYIGQKHKLKELKKGVFTRVYTVCTLLRNIHIGFEGGQTSNYFELIVSDDFVEKYINQTDF
jgi:hypothetical protein